MTQLRRVIAWCVAFAATGSMAGTEQVRAAPADATSVVELRQYKIVHGKRDEMIRLFESAFIESQEETGIRIVGSFRDIDDPNRFVWLRSFDSMTARGRALNDFYYGPVWKARRGEANPLLADNDNVLLLRNAGTDLAFIGQVERPPKDSIATRPAGLVVVTIYYLWKAPEEGFAAFFHTQMRPTLDSAGLRTVAALTQEGSPNNFPQLPIRSGEKLFVWITRTDSLAQYDAAVRQLKQMPGWHAIDLALTDLVERAPQVLRLSPTSRSTLR
jgi:quinol monooxygenase YgiN